MKIDFNINDSARMKALYQDQVNGKYYVELVFNQRNDSEVSQNPEGRVKIPITRDNYEYLRQRIGPSVGRLLLRVNGTLEIFAQEN